MRLLDQSIQFLGLLGLSVDFREYSVYDLTLKFKVGMQERRDGRVPDKTDLLCVCPRQFAAFCIFSKIAPAFPQRPFARSFAARPWVVQFAC